MHEHSEFLSSLQSQSLDAFQRIGVVLQGAADWQETIISDFAQTQSEQRWFCVGDWSFDNMYCVGAKQGNRLLGRECDVLLFDARLDFDANSFAAALGALVGGGILLVVTNNEQQPNFAEQWMQMQWQKLIVIEQDKPLPELPLITRLSKDGLYSEQQAAVALIKKVVTGHRKRPLILTADRGRGKTSALGIACAHLLKNGRLRILLTAPSIKAVEPVYQHALDLLIQAKRVKKDRLEVEGGYIQFVAADELLSDLPECDLLLVDEAAAIPLPMLKQITAHYHRLVFSTTIHGYEGCGRGFTLKFVDWLQQHRPGLKTCHIRQAIRWSEGDNLESWMYNALLLNAELSSVTNKKIAHVILSKADKQDLIAHPNRLRQCFALLVNAHYQTSPNDLIHLLRDSRVELYFAEQGGHTIGVLLTVKEGALDDDLVRNIQLGKRRPKGQLVPATIVSQLGFTHVGKMLTFRVMRIAVHPALQGIGIGQSMLQQLEKMLGSNISYLSTSFGATPELIDFWHKAGFNAIRLGTMRDAASGCYSLLMVKQCGTTALSWVQESQALFQELLSSHVSDAYPKLEPAILRALLPQPIGHEPLHPAKQKLIQCYTLGGSSYESVSLWIQQCLLQYGLSSVSDVMISKVFLNGTWKECANQFNFSGRREVEQFLQDELKAICVNLHCKRDTEN